MWKRGISSYPHFLSCSIFIFPIQRMVENEERTKQKRCFLLLHASAFTPLSFPILRSRGWQLYQIREAAFGHCFRFFAILCKSCISLVFLLLAFEIPSPTQYFPKQSAKVHGEKGCYCKNQKSSGLANLVSQFGEFGYPVYRDKRATFSEAPSTERIKEVLVFCKSLQPQQATGSTVWIWTSM